MAKTLKLLLDIILGAYLGYTMVNALRNNDVFAIILGVLYVTGSVMMLWIWIKAFKKEEENGKH